MGGGGKGDGEDGVTNQSAWYDVKVGSPVSASIWERNLGSDRCNYYGAIGVSSQDI